MYTKSHGDLVTRKNFLTEARVCSLMGVQSCLEKRDILATLATEERASKMCS